MRKHTINKDVNPPVPFSKRVLYIPSQESTVTNEENIIPKNTVPFKQSSHMQESENENKYMLQAAEKHPYSIKHHLVRRQKPSKMTPPLQETTRGHKYKQKSFLMRRGELLTISKNLGEA